MTGKEMLKEIWRELREDIKSWNIQWRWLTREELRDMHPKINPATGLPLVGRSMIDGAGNPYGTDLSWTTRSLHQSSADDCRRSFSYCNDEFSPSRNRTYSDFNRDPNDW